ncbi:hypothetical protein D3C72_1568160 [compost metagenome]
MICSINQLSTICDDVYVRSTDTFKCRPESRRNTRYSWKSCCRCITNHVEVIVFTSYYSKICSFRCDCWRATWSCPSQCARTIRRQNLICISVVSRKSQRVARERVWSLNSCSTGCRTFNRIPDGSRNTRSIELQEGTHCTGSCW